MGNTLYYGKTPLNTTQTIIDDTQQSGIRTWSSQKISDMIAGSTETSCVQIGCCAVAGTRGVSIGANAGTGSCEYTDAISIGTSATAKGNNAIAIGNQATVRNKIGTEGADTTYNIAIGYKAKSPTSSSGQASNIVIGACSGHTDANSFGNIFIGECSGINACNGSSATMLENIFIGLMSGKDNITGNFNVFVGSKTGCGNFRSSYNTFIGNESGQTGNSSGCCYNTFIGYRSGSGFDGAYSTAVGAESGRYSENGSVSVGYCAQAGRKGTAIGTCSKASIGVKSTSEVGGIAIGFNSKADRESIVIGHDVKFGFTDAYEETSVGDSGNNIIIGNCICTCVDTSESSWCCATRGNIIISTEPWAYAMYAPLAFCQNILIRTHDAFVTVPSGSCVVVNKTETKLAASGNCWTFCCNGHIYFNGQQKV